MIVFMTTSSSQQPPPPSQAGAFGPGPAVMNPFGGRCRVEPRSSQSTFSLVLTSCCQGERGGGEGGDFGLAFQTCSVAVFPSCTVVHHDGVCYLPSGDFQSQMMQMQQVQLTRHTRLICMLEKVFSPSLPPSLRPSLLPLSLHPSN